MTERQDAWAPRYAVFPLSDNGYAHLEYPQKMSAEGLKEMEKYLRILMEHEGKIIATGEKEPGQ